MNLIAKEDLRELKKPEYLVQFCDDVLGQGTKTGEASVYYYCPWEEHTKPHLDVHAYKGAGTAHCWRCGQRGNIFDIARAVTGRNTASFSEIVKYVAGVLGYNLKKSKEVKMQNTYSEIRSREIKTEGKIQYMPEDEEIKAWKAAGRARMNLDTLVPIVRELGIQYETLLAHADMGLADYGMIGVTDEGRLMYIYTARDKTGKPRVVMTKQRGAPGEEPRFRCGKGSRKEVLYGAEAIQERSCVIITEGESDALAARAALVEWAGIKEPLYEIEKLPVAVVAKPDAGTFKEIWAKPLAGKEVILCVDNDEAGIKGALKSCEILQSCGVGSIGLWSARCGAKDVRDAYRWYADAPGKLVEDIFHNLIKV